MTDVLAISMRIARILDPIAQDHRAAVIETMRLRYHLKPLSGAERKKRHQERWGTVENGGGALPGTEKGGALPPTPPSALSFRIPESIEKALSKSRILGSSATLRRSDYWQSQVRAYPGVDYAAEVLKAEAWMVANPRRAPRKNFGRFLHTWLGRAERAE